MSIRYLVMNRFVASALPVLALCLLAAAPAYSAQRTFVSTKGVNNPACSLVAPCRDFATAVTATSAGGEVIVLDSGGYGKVTITQSVSIIAAPGVYAGISVFPGDDGVTVAGGGNVKLRGLTINGQGGNRGIVVTSAFQLYIEQCTIANMVQSGIEITGGTDTFIRGSAIHSNGQHGLHLVGFGSVVHMIDSQFVRNQVRGVFIERGHLQADRITVEANGDSGLVVVDGRATVTDSTLSGNGSGGVFGHGAFVQATLGNGGFMEIIRSTVAGNFSMGIVAGPSGPLGGIVALRVSDSAVINNGRGVFVGGDANITGSVTGSTIAGNSLGDLFVGATAVLRTSENNSLTGLVTDISGVLTPNPLK